MKFDYCQYYRGCFLLPSAVLVVLVLLLLANIVKVFLDIHRNKTEAFVSQKIVGSVIFVSLIMFFCSMKISYLMNGGIYLFAEKEESAIEVVGTVEQIEHMNLFQFPSKLESEYKTDEAHGVCITIDGTNYRAIAKGSLAVGDVVTLSYLPKSRYVLSINEI